MLQTKSRMQTIFKTTFPIEHYLFLLIPAESHKGFTESLFTVLCLPMFILSLGQKNHFIAQATFQLRISMVL